MPARTVAQGHGPGDLAAVHVVGGDPGVGRLDQRQVARAADVARDAADVVEGRAARVRLAERVDHGPGEGRHVEHARLRVEGASGPARAAAVAGHQERAAFGGRREYRSVLVSGEDGHRLAAELRREVDQIARAEALALEGRRPAGEGLRRRRPLADDAGLGHFALQDRPHRFAGAGMEDVEEALLGELHRRPDRASLDLDVADDGRSRQVVVPQAMVDHLEVPAALPGLAVDRDQRLGVEVVAQAVPAVPVVRRRAERQVGEAELRVGAHQGPDVRVAADLPRTVLPGVAAGFALLRNRMERPELLAGADVESADVPRRCLGRARPVRDRRADDRHVAAEGDRRTHAVDPPRHFPVQTEREVDAAAISERGDRFAAQRVHRAQEGVAARPHQPAAFAGQVRVVPVRGPAMREAEVRRPAMNVGLGIVGPQTRSLLDVDRRDLPVAGRHVEPAADLDRNRLMVPRHHAPPRRFAIPGHQLVVRRRPTPGNLELSEVVPIDLPERRVPLARVVAGRNQPVRIGRLLGRRGDHERHRQADWQEPHALVAPPAKHQGTVAARSGPLSPTPSSLRGHQGRGSQGARGERLSRSSQQPGTDRSEADRSESPSLHPSRRGERPLRPSPLVPTQAG